MSEAFNTSHLCDIYGEAEPAVFNGYLTTRPEVFMQLVEDPEIVLRRQLVHSAGPEEARSDLQRYFKRDIECIRGLGRYGIASPNYIIVGFEDPEMSGGPYYYTATNKVYGRYFSLEHLEFDPPNKGSSSRGWHVLADMPEDITVNAMERMLSYYASVLTGETRVYYDDLRLGNLIVGRLQGDQTDDIYMFDYEIQRSLDVELHGVDAARFGTQLQPGSNVGWALEDDLHIMQHTYGSEYPELQQRIDEIVERADTMIEERRISQQQARSE